MGQICILSLSLIYNSVITFLRFPIRLDYQFLDFITVGIENVYGDEASDGPFADELVAVRRLSY